VWRGHLVPVYDGRGAICREVLESLPEWFGIPASVESYVAADERLPMLACFDPAGEVVGFVSVKTQTVVAAEVYVMGAKHPWHRRGIGRALIEGVVELAISQGARFLTVKSLTTSNDDPNYARTRLFYEAIRFLPIEEFPTLWGPENPLPFDASIPSVGDEPRHGRSVSRGEPSPVGRQVGIPGASRRYAWNLLVPIADHPASRLAKLLPWKWKAGPATLAA